MKNAGLLFLVTALADLYELPDDPRLRLAPPLVSRWVSGGKVTVNGNRTETQGTVESVGCNSAKHITHVLSCHIRTEKVIQRIVTIHRQMFASPKDTVPAATDVRTTIMDYLEGTPESKCRLDEIFMTVVDKDGVHRFPAAQAKTFL
jgi:hypothetical protein